MNLVSQVIEPENLSSEFIDLVLRLGQTVSRIRKLNETPHGPRFAILVSPVNPYNIKFFHSKDTDFAFTINSLIEELILQEGWMFAVNPCAHIKSDVQGFEIEIWVPGFATIAKHRLISYYSAQNAIKTKACALLQAYFAAVETHKKTGVIG